MWKPKTEISAPANRGNIIEIISPAPEIPVYFALLSAFDISIRIPLLEILYAETKNPDNINKNWCQYCINNNCPFTPDPPGQHDGDNKQGH